MIVELEDVGEIEFPDSMSPEQVAGVLRQQRASPPPVSPDVPGLQRDTAMVSQNPTGRSPLYQEPPTFWNPLSVPKVREPITGTQGLGNTVANAANAAISPVGAALGPLSRVPLLQPIIAGTLAGMGAKTVGQSLGQLSGTPNPTMGQYVETGGDVLQGLAMNLPLASRLAPKPPVYEAVPVDEPNRFQEPASTARNYFSAGQIGYNRPKQLGFVDPNQLIEGQSRPIAGQAEPVPPVLAEPIAPSPAEQYNALRSRQSELIATGQINTPEFMDVWRQMEAVKNSLPGAEKGYLPKGVAEQPVVEQAVTAQPQPIDTTGIQHDLKSATQAIRYGLTRGTVSAEQAQAYQAQGDAIFARASQGEAVGPEAEQLWRTIQGQNAQGVPVNQRPVQGQAPGDVGQGDQGNGGGDLQLDTGGQEEPGGTGLGQEGQAAQGPTSTGDSARKGQGAGVGGKAYSGLFFLDPDFWRAQGGVVGNMKADSLQLYNTLRNKLGDKSAAWGMLDTPEFKAFMAPGQRRSMDEVRQWVESNGPKVEVRKFVDTAKGALTQARDLAAQAQHTLDTEGYEVKGGETGLPRYLLRNGKQVYDRYEKNNDVPDHIQKALKDLSDARAQIANSGRQNAPEGSAHWQSIAPKTDMPGYVEIAVVKPTSEGDLRTAYTKIYPGDTKFEGYDEGSRRALKQSTEKFPSSHNFPPNTLGFVRGYMETVGDRKVFHVIEVQSDWAQQHRDAVERMKRDPYSPRIEGGVPTYEKMSKELQDPLLPHYERLALKAAIEHAREQGATHIALQDAESAMMMEGHDRQNGIFYSGHGTVRHGQAKIGDFGYDNGDGVTVISEGGTSSFAQKQAERSYARIKELITDQKIGPLRRLTQEDFAPTQSKGMRLHYDQTLPKIAKELTGSEGERVSFGEHKMAFSNEGQAFAGPRRQEIAPTPRKDLIFRNEAGQPKTDVSARLYPIGKARQNFSLTGSDKPVVPQKGMQIKPGTKRQGESGSVYIPVKEAVDAFKTATTKLRNGLASRDVKSDVVRLKDVADNAAVMVGQRARTGQEALAKVLFPGRHEDALAATTAAIEAEGDKSRLQGFARTATAKGDKAGLDAATFAYLNWDRLQPLVARAQQQHDMVFNEAVKEGVSIEKRSGYIRHLYDLSKIPSHLADAFFSGQGGGGKGFKKERSFDTLYDAIQAGYGKAIKTWNSAELLENRLRHGFQEINDLQWAKSFQGVVDPTTKKAIVSLAPRPGYEAWTPFPGKTFHIHRGYLPVFKAAQGASAIRDFELAGLPVGQALMKGTGTIKHSLLMYDTFHAIRIGFFKAGSMTGKPFSHRAGLALLEYNPKDLANAVAAGEIKPEMAAWANAKRPVANLLIKEGLNVGRVQEALDADWIKKLNFLYSGTVNKFIFEKLTRGALLESAVVEFERVKKANPGLPDQAVAQKVAKDINFYFGNIGRQGLIRSKTGQDLARLMFLAPQWFESMGQTELRSIGQGAKALGTGKVGTLAKGTGTLLLGMFVATQILNLVMTGHTTDKNPEGHKLEAFVPGGDNGFYVSPFSIPMELTHDVIRYSHQGKSPLAVGTQILGNKYAPLFRAEEVLRTRRDYKGTELEDGEALKAAGMSVLPLPLPVQAGLNPNASLQRQLSASAGFKIEPAESGKQRIGTLARSFMKEKGVKQGQFPPSEYGPILKALSRDKLDEAKTLIADLSLKKKPEVIDRYFESLPNDIHTQSKEMEEEFFNSLSAEDKKLYGQVREQNQALSDKYFSLVGHLPPMRRHRRSFDTPSYSSPTSGQ